MSSAVERPQHLVALAEAQRIRMARCAVKRELKGAADYREGLRRTAEVIADPPAELHGMRLHELIAAPRCMGNSHARKLLGPPVLNLRRLGVTLGDLTPAERGRVLAALEVRIRGGRR